MLDDYPTRSRLSDHTAGDLGRANAATASQPGGDRVGTPHCARGDPRARTQSTHLTIPESKRRVIRIHMNSWLVHAPTAAVVYELHEVLAGRHTPGCRPGAAGPCLALTRRPPQVLRARVRPSRVRHSSTLKRRGPASRGSIFVFQQLVNACRRIPDNKGRTTNESPLDRSVINAG